MYAIKKMRENQKELLYKVYITDALKIIADNTAHFAGGTMLSKRYYDLAYSVAIVEKEDPEKIIAEVTAKAGLEIIGEGG